MDVGSFIYLFTKSTANIYLSIFMVICIFMILQTRALSAPHMVMCP